jgi:hypothetical protein
MFRPWGQPQQRGRVASLLRCRKPIFTVWGSDKLKLAHRYLPPFRKQRFPEQHRSKRYVGKIQGLSGCELQQWESLASHWHMEHDTTMSSLTLLLHTSTNKLYVLPDDVGKQSNPGHEHGWLTSRQRGLKTIWGATGCGPASPLPLKGSLWACRGLWLPSSTMLEEEAIMWA